MSTESQVAIVQPPAFLAVAGLTGLDAKYLVETVKKQCFKGAATDEQVDAFISIACEMKVNPLLPGMLYAYPISGGGIVPIMGPSGVYKKLVEHPEVDSWETEVFPEDVTKPPTHAVTKIYRKGRDKPLQYTALLSEWKIASNPNWNSRPRHMLALRSLKHCANQIIHGIPYDEDDRAIMAMQNVTGTGDSGTPVTTEGTVIEQQRPLPKERAKRGVAAAREVVVEKEVEPTPQAKAAEDIQQVMKDRSAKTVEPQQSQRGDDNARSKTENKAAQLQGVPETATTREVMPPVPSDPAPAATPRNIATPAPAQYEDSKETKYAIKASRNYVATGPGDLPITERALVAAPRTSLKDGEKLSTTIKLETIQGVFMSLDGKRTACIKAATSGGFKGEVRCSFAATPTGALNDKGLQTMMNINSPFAVGKPLDVVLAGKMSKAPEGAPTHGVVIVWIETATAVQGEEVA